MTSRLSPVASATADCPKADQTQVGRPKADRGLVCCPQCGGRGALRLGDQSFRTCLECLGQGQIQLRLIQGGQDTASLSGAAVSASASR